MTMWLCTVSNLPCHWDMKAGSESALTYPRPHSSESQGWGLGPHHELIFSLVGQKKLSVQFSSKEFSKKVSGKQGIEPAW